MSSSIIKFISTTTKILLDINEKKNKDEQDLETNVNNITALEGSINIYLSSLCIQNVSQLIPNTPYCFLDKTVAFKYSFIKKILIQK